MMPASFVQCTIVVALMCMVSAYVDIPDDLKRGKMSQYAACRKLFAQTEESFAVVAEDSGYFKKVCNCTFHENPPQSGLRINCHFAKEVSVPITIDMYQHLGQVSYFIVRYRISGTSDEWREQRVDPSDGVRGTVTTRFNLDLGVDGSENIYEVEIYATLYNNTRRLIMSDQLSSNTGRSVLTEGGRTYPIGGDHTYSGASQSFSMNFDRITDTSMEITFVTESLDTFKVEYINNGRRLDVNLDEFGQATLTGLQADTEYIFIISYYRNGEWVEMRRKPVRTMTSRTIQAGSYTPTYNYGTRDITLECPVVVDENLQTVAWYKVSSGGTNELLASYDAQSGETSYPSNRDPKIEIIDGIVLRIKAATQEYAGHYKCRYSVYGAGYTWQAPFEPELVTLYITWETQPGIVAYYIQYRPYGTTQQWQTLTLRNALQPRTVVRDLQPVTQYEFQIYDYTGGVQGTLLDTVVRRTELTSDEGPDEDPCGDLDCRRGICDPLPTPHCICESGYTGANCDAVLNLCISNPCLNGGICNPRVNGYTCQCLSGYSGSNCERERTPCNPNPCHNAGVCVTVDNGYICRCRRGYGGQRCQLVDRSSPCDSRPCVYGSCSVLGRNYQCECERGYTGRNCDQVDTAPSILLRCPVQEDTYGRPELIQWVRISDSGRRQPIYRYDVVNQRRAEGTIPQYRGRLYSPSMEELIIRDSKPEDVGTYQCIVSYESIRISPSAMRLVQVPVDDTRVTVTWRPSRLLIDHYNAKYRNVESGDDWVEVEIPSSSRRHTFDNLLPGGVYEISIVPFTRPNEVNEPVIVTVISSDTVTTTAETTTTRRPSRGDSPLKYTENIRVDVYGPRSPVEVGTNAYITCQYPSFGLVKPQITWKKISGGQGVFLYNQQMPPSSSLNRITMIDEYRLKIGNFRDTDAGTYECNVEFETSTSFKIGKGQANVEAEEMMEIPAPTNLIIDVTGPDTAVLTWQAPNYRGITSYIIRYFPTTRRFAEYEREDTTEPHVTLESLEAGQEYDVEIRATDGRKYSAPLEGHFVQTIEDVPSPTNFRYQILSTTTARIMWNQDDTTGITGYKVQYWNISQASEGNLIETTTRPGETELILTGLYDGTVYQVWIQAVKGNYLSPQLSGQFRKTTPDIPNAPAVINFKNIGNDKITAYWDAPVGWKTSDKYRVIVKSLDADYPFLKRYPDSAPSMLTVTSLRPGVTYQFTLTTVRNGVLSSPVQGTSKTIEVISLSAPYPAELTLECKTRNTSRIYQVKWYKIDDSGDDNLLFTTFLTSTRSQSFPNRRNTQYNGRLSAPSLTSLLISGIQYPEDFGKYKCVTSTVGSPGYHILDLVATRPTVIAPPEGFEFDAVNDTTVKVTWRHPYDKDVSGYVVKYRPRPNQGEPQKIMETDKPEATLSGLTAGPEYEIDISAKIDDKTSDESLNGTVRLGERNPEPAPPEETDRSATGITYPSAVSNLRVEVLGRDSLYAIWDPTPDVHFDYYRIVLTNTRTNQDQAFNTTVPSIQISSLQPYQTYDITVSTVRNEIFSFPVAETVTLRDLVEKEPEDEELEPGEEKNEYERVEPAPMPTNLSFSNILRNRFTVEWDAPSDNVIQYEVKYTPSDGRSRWITIRTGYPTITLRGLRTGTSYDVAISSILLTGEKSRPLTGSQSTLRNIRVALRQPVVSVVGKTNDSFTLRWQPVQAKHRIYVTPIGGAGTRQTLDVDLGVSTITVTGLEPGKKHRATVIATSGGRRSKPAYVYPTTNPNQPENLRVTTLGSTSMVLRWTESVSTLVTGYNVIYFPTITNEMEVLDVTTNRAELTGLTPDTEYTIQVRTKQGNEESAPTSITATTRLDTIQAPGNAEVTISGNDILVRWSPVPTADSFEVDYYSEDDEGALTTHVIENPTNLYRISNVLPGHYVIKVASVKDDQRSPTIDMSITMPVKSPRNLYIDDIRRDRMTATWDAPQGVSYTPTYDVIALPTDTLTPLELPSEKRTRQTTYTFTRLNPNTEYRIEVIARYGNLKSAPSTATVSTLSLQPPDRIGYDVSDGVINVRWTPITDVDNYELTYYTVGDESNAITVPVPSGNTSYTIPNSGPGQYEIHVIAVKDGERSQPTTITLQTGVESPRSISFSDITEDAFVVEWTPPRTRARYDYEVVIRPLDNTEEPSIHTTSENLQIFTGLNPAATYTVEVVTLFGDRRSQPITATVTTGVPVVGTVEVPVISDGNLPIEIIWDNVDNADGYIVTYYPVGGSPQVINVEGGRNSISLTDLEPETEYVIEVKPVINDVSGYPTTLNIVTRPIGTPDTVDTQVIEDGVRFVWTPVENVDQYEVTYYPRGNPRNRVTNVVTTPYYDISGVLPGQYVVTVTAVKSDHRSQPTRVIQTIGVESPTEIDFPDLTENEIVVVWSPSPTSEVIKYVVRATNPNDLTQAPIIKETTDTFVRFDNLPSGTTYIIEVTAETVDQTSNPVIGTIMTGVREPDYVLENLPEEEGTLEINWQPVPNVDNYEVTYYPVGGEPQILLLGGDETGTILYDLEPGTDYIIEVKAIINHGISNPASVRVTTPLEKPQGPNSQPLTENTNSSSTSVRITWVPDDSVPEYEIKYYPVTRIDGEVFYGRPQTIKVPGHTGGTILSDLSPATEYIVEIKAIDGTKASRPGIITITTPLDEPEVVEISEPGEQEVTITWQHPVGDVTEYVIELIPSDGSQTIRIPVRPGQNSVRATGLQPGTEYEVRVVAINTDKDIESQPGLGTVRTLPADVKPINVQLRPESNGSYTVVWEAPSWPVHKYDVTWRSTSGTPTEHTIEVPGDQTHVVLPELLPDTDYEVIIHAISKPTDRVLTDYNSIIRRVKTEIPGLPDSVTIPDVSDQTVVIQWEHPTQDNYLTGYRIEVYPIGSDTPVKVLDVPRNESRVTLTGLKPSTSYTVKVIPHIDFKPGRPATHTIITSDIQTVPVPDYVTVSESTSEDIVIQWEPPHNYEYVTRYNIVVEDDNGTVILDTDVPGDTFSYTLTGLRPSTHYNVYIRSYVDDRPSEPIEEVATTLPEQPENVRSSNIRPNQFEISWTPARGDIVSYLVNVEPVDSTTEPSFFETDVPSILIPGVQPDTTYNVQVITLGPGNVESAPVTVTVTTGSSPVDSTPGPEIRPEESINILPGQPEIVIRWETLPEDQSVLSYQIIYRIPGSNETKIITVPSKSSEIILSSLEPREQYEVWIRAILDSGENIPVRVTDRHTVTIVPPEYYRPQTSEPIVAPEDGKVSIIWEKLGPGVTDYGIIYGTPDSAPEEQFQVVVPGTYSGTMLSGLIPGEEYFIKVIAVRDGQTTPVGNVNIGSTGIIPDETSVSSETPTGVITIHWTPEVDDEDFDNIIGYTVTFDRKCCLGEPEISWVPDRDSTQATIELEPNTEYVFTVEATRSDGIKKPVGDLQVTIEEPTPTPDDEDDDEIEERIPEYYPDEEYGEEVESTTTLRTTTTRRPVVTRTRPRSTTTTTTTSRRPVVTRTRPRQTTTTTRRPVDILTPIRPLRTTTVNPEPLENRNRTSTTTTRRTKPISTTTRPTTRRTTILFPEETEDGETVVTDNGQITISWEPFFHDDDEGNYKIVIVRPDRDEITETVLPGDAETVTVTSLEPGVQYNVYVEAVLDDEFQTPFQIPFTINEDDLPRRLHPYRYLFKPSITSIEPYGEDATIINWVNPRTQQRDVTHYVLQFTPKRPTASSQRVKVVIPADKERTSHIVTGLTPDVEYIVTLQVANEPTKTRSPTEKQDFIAGTVTIVPTTTHRPQTSRVSTPYPGPTTTRPTEPTTTTSRSETRSRRTTTTERTPRPWTTTPGRSVTTRRTTRPTSTARSQTTRRFVPTTSRTTTERSTTRRVIVPTTTRRTLRPLTTTPRQPIEGTTRRVTETTTRRRPIVPRTTTTQAPEEEGIRENTTPRTTVTDDILGVDVLPTFDGKVIINWTPATNPVDNYILQYVPVDGVTPGQKITIPGGTSWTSIPAPVDETGYVIYIYTVRDGDQRPFYNVTLGKSPDDGGFNLRYELVPDTDVRTTSTQTITHQVYVPASRTGGNRPDTGYTLQPEFNHTEYFNWLRPVTLPERPVGGPSTVTLRWNPVSTTDTTRVNSYRIELVPINNPNARTLITRVPSNRAANIRGLQPGVSYRLYARYMSADGEHQRGDIAASFVIPALSRFGVPITTQRFGINEVWVRELRTGELLLQWDEFPEATAYTIEYENSDDGILQRSEHGPEDRWIVLPHLNPGANYTIHIYATLSGILTKIYTVTVRRKITAPLPPIKVQWYNMMGHSVDLAWVASSSEITGYRITYYLGTVEDHEQEFVIDLPADATSVNLEDLIPGETYTIMIQTIRGDDVSIPITFPLKMIIPTVRRLFFQQTAPDVVVIRWDPLPDYVTGYVVYVRQLSPPGPDLIPETSLPPTQSTFMIPGVQAGVKYEFTIRTVVDGKLSEPVTLHLWTLRAESQISRVEQTGTWTVTWSGNPLEVDYWKIEVREPGSDEVVFSDDNIDKFNTRYQITDLTPGVEYIIYIYGVKRNVTSTPIQIRIPANPNLLSIADEVSRSRTPIYPTGVRLIDQFSIRPKPEQIEIMIIPATTVDRYEIQYKKASDITYISRNVRIAFGNGTDTAIVDNLDQGTEYNFKIKAFKGDDKSEVDINVRTLIRQKPPLQPLHNIRRLADSNPQSSGFYLTWDQPAVDVLRYNVVYNYTSTGLVENQATTETQIYINNISEGESLEITLSYVALDGRESPKSVIGFKVETRRSNRPPKFFAAAADDYDEGDEEQP